MTANKYADLASQKKTDRRNYRFAGDVTALLRDAVETTRFSETEILETLVRRYGPEFAKANAAKRTVRR